MHRRDPGKKLWPRGKWNVIADASYIFQQHLVDGPQGARGKHVTTYLHTYIRTSLPTTGGGERGVSEETDFTSRAHAATEALTSRVNGGLNSTVTPESTSGRDTRDSLYGFAGEAPFPSKGPACKRSQEPTPPCYEMKAYTLASPVVMLFTLQLGSSNEVGAVFFEILTPPQSWLPHMSARGAHRQ